jgi:uncharacterized protein YukE
MDQTFNQATRLMELWGEMATRMAMAPLAADPHSPPPEAARRVRASIFKTMTQAADEYMRSPEFLGMMKQSFEAGLQMREQSNDLLTRLRHELQGVARKDIDSLLQAVHQAESRVVEKLDDLSSQLDKIATRHNALEAAHPPAEEPKAPAPKNRRSQP